MGKIMFALFFNFLKKINGILFNCSVLPTPLPPGTSGQLGVGPGAGKGETTCRAWGSKVFSWFPPTPTLTLTSTIHSIPNSCPENELW